MFIKKKLTSKKESEKQFEFDIFKMEQNNKDDDQLLKIGQAKISYNFISQDGSLRSGYGFKEFTSPISEENLDDEHEFAVRGNEVSKIWKLKWYDKNSDRAYLIQLLGHFLDHACATGKQHRRCQNSS